MRDSLDQQFARFLRQQRGEMSYAEFSRKVGVTKSMLFRLENGQQSITLRRLEDVLKRLKCDVADVLQNKKS